MSQRVTNGVMAMRRWVKRLKNQKEPSLFSFGERYVAVYECQLCKGIEKGYHNMYDHLALAHFKKMDNDHFYALRSMKEPKDDKCVGERAGVKVVSTSIKCKKK